MAAETMTEGLRRQVRERSLFCPTCGQPTSPDGVRGLAGQIGVPHTVLWRFLKGSDATGRTLDKIAAWLSPTTETTDHE